MTPQASECLPDSRPKLITVTLGRELRVLSLRKSKRVFPAQKRHRFLQREVSDGLCQNVRPKSSLPILQLSWPNIGTLCCKEVRSLSVFSKKERPGVAALLMGGGVPCCARGSNRFSRYRRSQSSDRACRLHLAKCIICLNLEHLAISLRHRLGTVSAGNTTSLLPCFSVLSSPVQGPELGFRMPFDLFFEIVEVVWDAF